jgi:hypothetical protein
MPDMGMVNKQRQRNADRLIN